MASDQDVQIGKNLAEMRGDVSQQSLAEAMRKRGFKWSQSTVWSVEQGSRHLRLTEAEAIAEILKSTSGFFFYEPAENRLMKLDKRRWEAEENLRAAALAFVEAEARVDFVRQASIKNGDLEEGSLFTTTRIQGPMKIVRQAIFNNAQNVQRDAEDDAWVLGLSTVDEVLADQISRAQEAGFENVAAYRTASAQIARETEVYMRSRPLVEDSDGVDS